MIHVPPARPLRVAVFNDSALMRTLIRDALEANGMRVVTEAASGKDAAGIVARSRADVVVMDVVMPGVDGYEATRAIMDQVPTPIVMVSDVVDPQASEVIFAALAAGALHMAKAPPPPGDADYQKGCVAFAAIVRTVAGARLRTLAPAGTTGAWPAVSRQRCPPAAARVAGARHGSIDAIGIVTSTGGPQALVHILRDLGRAPVLPILPPILPTILPPILIVQHLAAGFAVSFARWLGHTTDQRVEIAVTDTEAKPGVIYMAPDDRHLGILSASAPAPGYVPDHLLRLVVSSAPPVERFRPSGTFLLQSLAALGKHALGVVLTGMGSDGAEGAAALRAAGGQVAVQDRSTSIIYGMPAAALSRGGADAVLAVDQVASWIRERSDLS